jgi:two-component system cell cycle response regulator DivK
MADELVLIIEDNEKNRKLARDVLQFNKYRTIETASAEEGLRLALVQRPDLILMDFQLPGMNGIEALARLRANPDTRAIPVIAVTASAMTEEHGQIVAAGFDAMQTKPIRIKEFTQVVRETLARRKGSSK